MSREVQIAKVAGLVAKGLFWTLGVVFDDTGHALERLVGRPMIVVFWHNRILGVAAAFRKFYPRGRGGVTVLTSPSRDGEILARVMSELGMGAVRGSSSRRGARALRELVGVIERGRDVAITPDGPRGPRYSLGPGVVMLAGLTGAAILPVHVKFSRALEMKTWDGFLVPLPFSQVCVRVAGPWFLPYGMSRDECEGWRRKLEVELRDGID